MHKKYYSVFSPQEDFSQVDHIIIGSGMGGLTTAAWLAKAGHKVVVFEKHYVPGGFTHTFKRQKGYQWDVGVHYLGNLAQGSGLRLLFDYLTNNNVDYEYMGDVYDVAFIGNERFEFKAGKEAFLDQMLSYFPQEKTALVKYIHLIDKANKRAQLFFAQKTFPPILRHTLGAIFRKLFYPYSDRTTNEVLSSLTTNKKLQAVLAAQCGDYGLTPSLSSFAAHALVIGHFMEGGYYPVGGADKIAEETINTINRHGGRVYINAPVEEILVEKNKVKGVKIEGHTILCKSVISNVGINNTFNFLLGEKERKRCSFNLNNIPPSSSHICLYVGLNQSDITLNLPKYNIWWHKNQHLDQTFENTSLKKSPLDFAYISFPSAKDPKWSAIHPEKATIQAIGIGKYEWFEAYENFKWKKRGAEYEALKEAFKEDMLEKLYTLLPQIKGKVDVAVVSTPLSTKHFTSYQNGEIYGVAHTPERFRLPFLRTETKIKGLRLVGQDITIVGVAGAMFSGLLGAMSIIRWGMFKQFKNIKKYDQEISTAKKGSPGKAA